MMLYTLRVAVILLLASALLLHLLRTLKEAVYKKEIRIRHGVRYSWRKNPALFALAFGVQSLICFLMLYVIIHTLLGSGAP